MLSQLKNSVHPSTMSVAVSSSSSQSHASAQHALWHVMHASSWKASYEYSSGAPPGTSAEEAIAFEAALRPDE